MSVMEPTDALRSIETALRLVIRDVLGETGWLTVPGAPDETKLEERRAEEEKRRDGAIASSSLLDYTETYHLTAIIEKNWHRFSQAFKDKARTYAFFGVVEDVRNSIAHSRELVPFERDLISGVAGQIRNQVSLYRSSRIESSKYYPLIESLKDNFGAEGKREDSMSMFWAKGPRLEVGEMLTFVGRAFNARGKPVKWQLKPPDHHLIDVGEGDSVVFNYTVRESDVRESFALAVRITTDSKYHRYPSGSVSLISSVCDDERIFLYAAVNPPEEE